MLTKNDLKQIRQVVKEEVQSEIQPVEKRLNNRIDRLDKKIDSLDKKIDEKTDSLDKKIDTVNRKLDKFDKEMGDVTEYIKNDQIQLHTRIERVENHVGLERP